MGFAQNRTSPYVCCPYDLVLRVDADAANAWSGQEVIERWGKVFSVPAVAGNYAEGGSLRPMQRETVSGYVEQFRSRLCDISWFMHAQRDFKAASCPLGKPQP